MKPLVLAVAVITTVSCVMAPLFAEDTALVRARALLDRVGLVDGHNDLPWTLRETFESDLSRVDLRQRGATVDTDIPRLREAGSRVSSGACSSHRGCRTPRAPSSSRSSWRAG